MSWFKKQKKEEEKIDPFVFCEDCRHAIERETAHVVFFEDCTRQLPYEKYFLYYCKDHAPEYNKVYHHGLGLRDKYYKTIPEQTVEVKVGGKTYKATITA